MNCNKCIIRNYCSHEQQAGCYFVQGTLLSYSYKCNLIDKLKHKRSSSLAWAHCAGCSNKCFVKKGLFNNLQ